MLQRPTDRRTRHRQRKAEGRCCVIVEVDGRIIDWLARPAAARRTPGAGGGRSEN
jgi:hypothetical protein